MIYLWQALFFPRELRRLDSAGLQCQSHQLYFLRDIRSCPLQKQFDITPYKFGVRKLCIISDTNIHAARRVTYILQTRYKLCTLNFLLTSHRKIRNTVTQGFTVFSDICKTFQNSRRQKSDIKWIPYTDSSPISETTTRNLVVRQTWRPRAVHPYTRTIINRERILMAAHSILDQITGYSLWIVDVSWVTSRI